MVAITQEVTTAVAIMQAYERGHRGSGRSGSEEHRPHLGASLIGHPCERHIWYTFRWALKEIFEGRQLRLFDSGHVQEPRIMADLLATGAKAYDRDPATGKQFEVWTHGDHFGGSMDGCAIGLIEAPKTWHVLEFKTHSQKSYDKLVKDGVKKAKPRHYDQMTIYMGLTEMSRAMYVAVNKNDDSVYTERVEFDRAHFKMLCEKALRIIKASTPPSKISEDPSWHECKFCHYSKLCHQSGAPEANCRTCAHSTPAPEKLGRVWVCNRPEQPDGGGADEQLTTEKQRVGCEQHRYIPVLLVKAGKPVDYHDGDVVYECADGRRFANGTGVGGIPSAEIHKAGATDFLADLAIIKVASPGSTMTVTE